MTRATCRFESYGYSKQELLFDWVATGNQVNVNISLAQFDVSTSLVALTVPNILLIFKNIDCLIWWRFGNPSKIV